MVDVIPYDNMLLRVGASKFMSIPNTWEDHHVTQFSCRIPPSIMSCFVLASSFFEIWCCCFQPAFFISDDPKATFAYVCGLKGWNHARSQPICSVRPRFLIKFSAPPGCVHRAGWQQRCCRGRGNGTWGVPYLGMVSQAYLEMLTNNDD